MLTPAKQFLDCTVTQPSRNKRSQEIVMLLEINKDYTSLISNYFEQIYRA